MRAFNLRLATGLMVSAAAIATMTAPAFAGRYDNLERWVDIVNIGDEAAYYVYITDIDDNYWGNDLLGRREIIYAGDSTRVFPIDEGYCRYDIKVVFESGRETTLFDVNLCEAVAIRVDEDGYTRVIWA